MIARELKFDVDYVVKVDDAPFYKGTIVRCKLDEDDNDYCVRFIAGNRVGYLCPDKFKEFSSYNGWEHMKVFVSLFLNTS